MVLTTFVLRNGLLQAPCNSRPGELEYEAFEAVSAFECHTAVDNMRHNAAGAQTTVGCLKEIEQNAAALTFLTCHWWV